MRRHQVDHGKTPEQARRWIGVGLGAQTSAVLNPWTADAQDEHDLYYDEQVCR